MNNSNLRNNNDQKVKAPILPKHIHDDQNGLSYTLHGDYYYPDLIFPDRDPRPLGKWGRMHECYLIKHKPVLYSQLILQGNLRTYLADLDEQATARLETLVRSMQRSEGVDERMNAQDQLTWVRKMNNIRHRAEENVIAELIFI